MAYYSMGILLHDYDDIEGAIGYFKKGVTSSILSDYPKGKLMCYYWLARCYRRIADYPKYEKYLRLLQSLSVKMNNNQYLAYAYEGFGNLNRYLGEYSVSITFYLKSIELSKKLGNLTDVSMALNNMSLVYEYQGNISQAIKIQLQNYSLLIMQNNKKAMVLCLSNLYQLHKTIGGNHEANRYLRRAMQIIEEVGEENINFKEICAAYSQFASMQLERGNYEVALNYYKKEFSLKEKHKDIKGISDSYGYMAYTYELLGNPNKVEDYYLKKLNIARAIDYTKGQLEAIKYLMALQVKQKNFKEAYEYSQRYLELNEHLRNKETAKQMAEFETKMKVKEQNQRIDLLLKDNDVKSLELEKERYNSFSLTIGVVLLVVIIILFYWGYRQKLRVNKELAYLVTERTKILNRRNKDLKDFIYRSSHELRSPIVNVKGLLNIIKNESPDADIVKDCLSKISDVVDRQDLMLQNLLRVYGLIDNKIEPENLKIKNLFEEIIESFKYTEYAEGVRTIIQSNSDIEIKTDKIMLMSIIENLVVNAMKYKRRQKDGSYVKLEAYKNGEGIMIRVSDNGIGISEDWKEKIFEIFTRAASGISGFGLGLYIVRNTVELLGGNISVNSRIRVGSEFTIWLPRKHKIRELN